MSDTNVQECNCCGVEDDCISGLCVMCSDYNYKLQKQVELLTLGLLQEKQTNKKLRDAIKVVLPQISSAMMDYQNARYIDTRVLSLALEGGKK